MSIFILFQFAQFIIPYLMNLLYDSDSDSINQMKSGLLGRGPWKVRFPEKPSLAAAMALRL